MSDAALRVWINALKSLIDVFLSVVCLGVLFIAAMVLSGQHVVERTTEAEATVLVLAAIGFWQVRGWSIAVLNWIYAHSEAGRRAEAQRKDGAQ